MTYSLDFQQKVWILSKFGFRNICGVMCRSIAAREVYLLIILRTA